MKYHDYVKIISWFYEWYSWYVVEEENFKYKVYITYKINTDFEHITSWWIPESSLELIK